MKMNFCYSKRSVACALLMVVFFSVALGRTVPDSSVQTTPDSPVETTPDSLVETTPDALVETTPNSSLEIVDSPVERPVVISEDLTVNCAVYLASYGLDDSPRYGYVQTSGGSWTDILTLPDAGINRGVTIFDLDPATCTTRNRQTFDTWKSEDDRVQMLEALESAAVGTIIVGVSADSADLFGDFQKCVGPFFRRYNLNIYGLQNRDKFSFLLQKGYPRKTVYRRALRYQESIWLKVVLTGNTNTEIIIKEA